MMSKILLMSTDHAYLSSMEVLLNNSGHSVLTFDGEEELLIHIDKASDDPFDLVVMIDYDSTGPIVARRTDGARLATKPILLLSGRAKFAEEIFTRGLCDGYLGVPFNNSLFIAAVTAMLAGLRVSPPLHQWR